MTEYPYVGFRFSCISKDGEFYHSTTCRYVPFQKFCLPGEEKVCDMPGVQDANGQTLPACQQHKELYEVLKKTFISIGEDKEKFAQLLKPQPLTRSYGVDLSNKYD